MYGKMNQNFADPRLLVLYFWCCGYPCEYTFRYTLTGDYITGMTIEENIKPDLETGDPAENNNV